MELQYFLANRYNPVTFIPQIRKEWKPYFELEAFKNYDPLLHKIRLDKHARPDKEINVPIPNAACDVDGKTPTQVKIVKVARIAIPMQKLIVSRAVGFLTGGKVEIKAKPQTPQETEIYDWVKETWRRNKLQYKNADIARRFMSETECAEIWYSQKDDEGNVVMRMQIFSPSKGDELIPVFDPLGNLLAFARGYKVEVDGKEICYMDVYDDEMVVYYKQEAGLEWEKIREVKHQYGKIPVIYYSLERSAWADVQIMIDRLETLISNFADTNDYNGSPILFAKGQIEGFSNKGEAGKVIQGQADENGKEPSLEYVTWDKAPDSIKLEIETLIDLIYTMTQTPNISFDKMAEIGDISAVAFDRIMIDAHLKASDMQNGMYGECIQRRLNFLIAAGVAINPDLSSAKSMEISPEFSRYTIDNVNSRVELAMKANGNKPVMSHLESISYTQLSDDPEQTLKDIEVEDTPNEKAPN